MASAIPWIGLGLQAIGMFGGKGKKMEFEPIGESEHRKPVMDYMYRKMMEYDQNNPFKGGQVPETPWSAHQAGAVLPNLFLGQQYQVPQMRGWGSGGGTGTGGGGGAVPGAGGGGGGNPWAAYRASIEKKMGEGGGPQRERQRV